MNKESTGVFSSIKRMLTKRLKPNGPEHEKSQVEGEPMYRQVKTADEILVASRGRKLMVLKHSATCPISSRAKRELDSLLADNPDLEVYLVVVQQQRDVSNELAEKLDVLHESPQLLLIGDGMVLEYWSHQLITRELVEAALG